MSDNRNPGDESSKVESECAHVFGNIQLVDDPESRLRLLPEQGIGTQHFANVEGGVVARCLSNKLCGCGIAAKSKVYQLIEFTTFMISSATSFGLYL